MLLLLLAVASSSRRSRICVRLLMFLGLGVSGRSRPWAWSVLWRGVVAMASLHKRVGGVHKREEEQPRAGHVVARDVRREGVSRGLGVHKSRRAWATRSVARFCFEEVFVAMADLLSTCRLGSRNATAQQTREYNALRRIVVPPDLPRLKAVCVYRREGSLLA